MKKFKFVTALLIILLSFSPIYSQVVKAAVTAEPGNRLVDFFNTLSERSGIKIHQIPLLPHEIENALAQGLVDIAILPDNERTNNIALIQAPVMGVPYALISESGFVINERNMVGLRTVAVLMEDEPSMMRELIDKYSIDPRIQKARHYDSLVKFMSSGRVTAIFIPLDEFEKSLRHINEDRNNFGQPFILGFKENFMVLSKKRANQVAPLMDRLFRALEEMKSDGTMEELKR